MSQIPRRTSEFQTGSAKRSVSKPSRSTLVRSQSTAGNGGGVSGNARPSSLAFPRLSSATPMRTPSRTPKRSSSKDRPTMVPMTAEKEKAPVDDREFLQSMNNLILEELSRVETFNEIVQKRSLKSMTLKNFIMILQHFISPICSVPKDFVSNYIDFLYHLLMQLDYPYNINKSSLKTPNAPHCMNSTIVLLGWLAEFSKFDEDDIAYRTTEEISNPELMREFMNHAKSAYFIFNEDKDTKDVESKISNLYLEMCAGPGSDVESEISRLQFEIEQLEKEKKPLSLANELKTKQDQSQQFNEQIKVHNSNIDGLNRKISNLKAECGMKREVEEHSLEELESLKNKFKNQQMTLDQRRNLLIEMTQIKSALASKSAALAELSETSAEREIILSNAISRKFQLIDRLNNLLFKIVSDLEIAGVHMTFDPAELQIQSTKNDQHTSEMIDVLLHNLNVLKDKYNSVLSAIKENAMRAEAEVQAAKTQNDLHKVQLQKFQSVYEKLEDEESVIEEELASLVQNIQSNYNERIEQIEKSKQEIVERKKGIAELEHSIQVLSEKRTQFGAKSVAECRQLYEQRKNEVDTRRMEVRKTIRLIDEYERSKEPLPERHQKLLDDIMRKKREERKILGSTENTENP